MDYKDGIQPSQTETQATPEVSPVRQRINNANARRVHRRVAFRTIAENVGGGLSILAGATAIGALVTPFSGSREPQDAYGRPQTVEQTNVFQPVIDYAKRIVTQPQDETQRIHKQMIEEQRKDGNPELKRQREQSLVDTQKKEL
jgi:hypothetical protein